MLCIYFCLIPDSGAGWRSFILLSLQTFILVSLRELRHVFCCATFFAVLHVTKPMLYPFTHHPRFVMHSRRNCMRLFFSRGGGVCCVCGGKWLSSFLACLPMLGARIYSSAVIRKRSAPRPPAPLKAAPGCNLWASMSGVHKFGCLAFYKSGRSFQLCYPIFHKRGRSIQVMVFVESSRLHRLVSTNLPPSPPISLVPNVFS